MSFLQFFRNENAAEMSVSVLVNALLAGVVAGVCRR